MKRLFIVFIWILCIFFIGEHIIEHLKLTKERDEYKKLLNKIREENIILKEKRDRLKNPDYDTIREKATELGFIREEEKIIRFYK